MNNTFVIRLRRVRSYFAVSHTATPTSAISTRWRRLGTGRNAVFRASRNAARTLIQAQGFAGNSSTPGCAELTALITGRMSDQLVWQIIKGHNAFVRKGLHGFVLSAEKGNLYNKHSYKYSGLANSKTVDIAADEGTAVAVTVSRPKNKSKPAQSQGKAVTKKRLPRKQAAIRKQVAASRPDLQNAAVARLSAIARSQRSAAARSS